MELTLYKKMVYRCFLVFLAYINLHIFHILCEMYYHTYCCTLHDGIFGILKCMFSNTNFLCMASLKLSQKSYSFISNFHFALHQKFS